MIKIIDTHAHYDDEAFDADREELIASLPEHGIEAAVNVGASMEGARKSVELARRYPHMYAACGIHPDETGCLDEDGMRELAALCGEEKCVAVGEIGLDYHWMVQPKEVQRRWFIRQLELAKELALPVNIHSRDAAQDTFDIMKAHHAGTTGGIIHCYSGSVQMAADYVRLGYYLGIGGVVTFKNGRVLKEVVVQTPLEYLVTETDSPYLAPEPNRGRRSSSLNLPYVVEEIARLKGMQVRETARVLYENAVRVYRLPLAGEASRQSKEQQEYIWRS